MTNLSESILKEANSGTNSDSKRAKTDVDDAPSNTNHLNHDSIDLDLSTPNEVNTKDNALMWHPAQTKIEQMSKQVEFRLLIEQKYNIKLG